VGTKRRGVFAAGLVAGAMVLVSCASAPSAKSGSSTSTTGSAGATTTSAPAPVPARYQSEYALVAAQTRSFGALSRAGARRPQAATTMGTELLTANGNIGAGLLQADAIVRVDAELDAFTALGVSGVTVDVSFPLLLPSTPDSTGYLAFYEQVARAVRAHHMVLSVEENPIFSGTPLTSLPISYRGLTPAGFAAEQHAQAQLIVDDLEPAYLTILDEPDTFSDTVGVDIDSPSGAVAFVNGVLDGLQRGTTLLGAGTGNWEGPSIDQALVAQTTIDYLDVHVYLFGPAALSNLTSEVSVARVADKPLVMDETWLNKPTPTQGNGPAGAPDELKLKSYSFWEPLDEQYVGSMVRYARAQGFRYVSFFDGARAFFAYLPWSPTLEAATYAQFTVQYNQLVAANMSSGTVSGTGQVFRGAVRTG